MLDFYTAFVFCQWEEFLSREVVQALLIALLALLVINV
jgi:hypothetical protein